MTTEDYVSFETAKLLKEKGFDEMCHCTYTYDGHILKEDCIISNSEIDEEKQSYTAPTLQMAMKWLREEHRIDIVIRPYITTDGIMHCYEIKKLHDYMVEGLKNHAGYETHEEAAEAAIKYCLESII